MRIDQLREDQRGELYRVTATMRWESVTRPAQEVYYEVPAAFRSYLAAAPEAFLTLAVFPAMRLGEDRVYIDGEVCPELCEGLQDSMAWIARWNPRRTPLHLDVEMGCAHATQLRGDEAGALLSGGVDALSLLRFNHLRFPVGHPRRIGVGIVVRGLWGVEPSDADAEQRLRRAGEALGPLAAEAGITLVPVFTNLQNLSDGDIPFWQHEFQGAALASFGHVLSRRLTTLSIAGTWDIGHLGQWGSHPAIDHNYGTDTLAIRHEMARWSRPAKLGLLADWPLAIRSLRVCNRQPEADRNCGRCEKCLRTMLALIGLGLLQDADTFERNDLDACDLTNLYIGHADVEGDYIEAAEILRQVGRDDLATSIERRIRQSRMLRRNKRLRAAVKRFDDHYLKGVATTARRWMRSHPDPAVGC